MHTKIAPRQPSVFSSLLLVLIGLLQAGSVWADFFSNGPCILEIDGRQIALLQSFSGGASTGVVEVGEPYGISRFPKKSLLGMRGTDLVFTVAGNPSVELLKWIQDNLTWDSGGWDGSIVMLDEIGREKRRVNFTRGLITEINLPTLAATSKGAFTMSLRVSTESSEIVDKSSGERYLVPMQPHTTVARIGDFKIDITGLDTSRVLSIDAISLKREVKWVKGNGPSREYFREVNNFEVSDVVLRLSNINTKGIETWYQDFVVGGRDGDEQERDGILYLLAPDLRTTLFKISLNHLGIRGLSYDYNSSYNYIDTWRGMMLRAQMYVESLSVEAGSN